MLRVLSQTVRRSMALAFALLALTALPTGAEVTMEGIGGVLDKAAEMSRPLPLPDNSQTAASMEQAARLMEQFNAPENQARIQNEQQRLLDTVFKATNNAKSNEPPALTGKNSSDRERLYLFVSSSMPLATLRTYAAKLDQAKASQVSMVLRGFVGGMKKARTTMIFISEILKKDPACEVTRGKCEMLQVNIQIDPERFQRYRIEEVPVLAYVTAGLDGEDVGEPLLVSGDASLDALLVRIDQEAKSSGLQRLIAAVSGSMEPGGRQ